MAAVQSSVKPPLLARFGDYELDLETAELRRAGRVVPLERQPGRALVLLVSRSGRLVSRTELQRWIWTDGTNVDFERGLNYCIRQIRQMLDDGARAPRFIETVPRQGYRFLAPVVTADTAAAPPSPSSSAGLRAAAGPSRRAAATVLRAVMSATAVVLSLAVLSRLSSAPVSARDSEHHAAAVAIVRTIHDAAFGPTARTGAHHNAAKTIARAVHDLIF